MEIQVKVSQAELDEMGVTQDELTSRMVEQLDEATLSAGRPSVPWCAYWVTVTVAT